MKKTWRRRGAEGRYRTRITPMTGSLLTWQNKGHAKGGVGTVTERGRRHAPPASENATALGAGAPGPIRVQPGDDRRCRVLGGKQMETAIKQCEARSGNTQCTGPEGHAGMHGIFVGGGIVFAPWFGDSGAPGEPCNLLCDCCRSPLILRRAGRTFSCSKCDQTWSFTPEGQTSRTVIAKMFPAWDGMDSAGKLEALEHRANEYRFVYDARLLLGDITAEEHGSMIAALNLQVEEKRATIPSPSDELPKPSSWFRRVLDACWKWFA